jgi:hypothetical protein
VSAYALAVLAEPAVAVGVADHGGEVRRPGRRGPLDGEAAQALEPTDDEPGVHIGCRAEIKRAQDRVQIGDGHAVEPDLEFPQVRARPEFEGYAVLDPADSQLHVTGPYRLDRTEGHQYGDLVYIILAYCFVY